MRAPSRSSAATSTRSCTSRIPLESPKRSTSAWCELERRVEAQEGVQQPGGLEPSRRGQTRQLTLADRARTGRTRRGRRRQQRGGRDPHAGCPPCAGARLRSTRAARRSRRARAARSARRARRSSSRAAKLGGRMRAYTRTPQAIHGSARMPSTSSKRSIVVRRQVSARPAGARGCGSSSSTRRTHAARTRSAARRRRRRSDRGSPRRSQALRSVSPKRPRNVASSTRARIATSETCWSKLPSRWATVS